MCTKRSNGTTKETQIGLIFIGISIVIIQLFCFSDGISGNDFWWHIKVGEYIWEYHKIPTTDIFSWIGVELGLPWIAHEWLSDVLLYLLHSTWGSVGVFCFSLIAGVVMMFLLFSYSKKYLKENILIGGMFFALFAVLTSLFFYGRPHIFSYFLLFWELKILYEFYDGKSEKGLYFLPIIGCLWSNLHGGSSNLAYILCIVFLIVAFSEMRLGRIYASRLSIKSIFRLLIVSVETVLSILINPIGYKIFIYPYENFANSLMMSVIGEWQAPDAKSMGELILYFVPIILIVIGIIAKREDVRLIDIVVTGMFLYMFFRSVRFIILWYIAVCFSGLRYMPKCKIKSITKKWEQIVVVLCILLLFIPLGMSFSDIVTLGKEDTYISEVMTDEVIEAVKCDSPQRIFSDYNLGEALIYNEIPTFFDARADVFSQEHILEDGISMMFLEQANTEAETSYVDVDQLIDKYKFDGILILKSRPLYSYLISHPEKFICKYEDDSIGYYGINE